MDPIETWHDAPEFERMEAKIKALELENNALKLELYNKTVSLAATNLYAANLRDENAELRQRT